MSEGLLSGSPVSIIDLIKYCLVAILNIYQKIVVQLKLTSSKNNLSDYVNKKFKWVVFEA